MRNFIAAAIIAFAVPSFAATWTSYEQLQAAASVNLRGDLETQNRDAGASFRGSRDASGGPEAGTATSSGERPKIEKPVLSKPEKIEPPGPVETKKLKLARAAGIAVAGAGLGMLAYAVAVGATGPVGAAAALIFLGGMTAYLSHRRLTGKTSGIFG